MAVESITDLLYNTEQLYNDLLAAGLLIAASGVHEALTDLRQRAREEREGA